ncbi:HEXXH motif domain-containing protein [Actinoplanes sp. TRM 88003]|uniref:HEXXH motif domain-containing protein n=1 Tax=Paractinoplanes aksuensis TaxID=2939490 RepID=A0ABT1DDY1_9ACTN|nr:HEXXH motif domain-containing protein [Actinoplanes aksuensis]MCO8269011.1 HEXXH motif domain-containing protein [Actinoplanes aksuensis]
MNGYHHLTSAQLAALAAGATDMAALAELGESRVSRHLLLLLPLIRGWVGDEGERDTAVSVLEAVQEADPQVFTWLIGDPMVGAWLSRTSRERTRTGDFLELGNFAAAAALRAGRDCRVTGWAREGRLVIPTMGTAVLGDDASAPVRIDVSGGAVTLIGSSGVGTTLVEGRNWWPLRQLRARWDGLERAVRIEDASPFRGGYHAAPSDRLDDDEAAVWQSRFAKAWSLIGRHLPDRATEIALGLRAVVPLIDSGDGSSRSATARESVGALGASRPTSAEDFAVTIVHEFAHSKLSGVIDIVPLYRPGGTELHRAPWKKDKRPTSGLLQGVFAFQQVADAWRCLAAEPALAEVARAQFTDLRDQVRVGYRSLAASRELTPAGAEFVAVLGAAVDRLFDEPAPRAR